MGYQLNTDFSTIAPSEGGQRQSFPVSDSKGWLCVMTESEGKENSAKTGRILAVKLQGMEGAVTGKFHEFTINTANPNPEAVKIGMEELSAIAHCVGHLRVGNSSELHNRPFRVIVALEKDQEKYPGATRIVAFRDQNGNKPSEAGQGALTNPNAAAFQQGQTHAQNPASFQQQQPQGQNGGGWGGAPQGNPAGNPGQGQPAMGQPGQGGGFGDPNAGGGFQGQPQGQNFQSQPQQGFDPNAGQTQTFQPGQFNPNTQQQPQQGQNPNGGGFQQQGGNGQPNWA